MAQSSLPHRTVRTLDRAFELTSLVPLAAFTLLHVADYARVLLGVQVIGAFHSPPGWALAVELVLVWLPFSFHGLYGLVVWRNRRREGASPASAGPLALHRLTGAFAAFYLAEHFVRFRWPILAGRTYPADAVQRLAAELSATVGGVPLVGALELFGVLAVGYHLSYGLYRIALRHALGSGIKALGVAIGAAIGLVAAATVLVLAGG